MSALWSDYCNHRGHHACCSKDDESAEPEHMPLEGLTPAPPAVDTPLSDDGFAAPDAESRALEPEQSDETIEAGPPEVVVAEEQVEVPTDDDSLPSPTESSSGNEPSGISVPRNVIPKDA
jgi:hypothetical protein